MAKASGVYTRFSIPGLAAFRIVMGWLQGQPRSFRADAARLVKGIRRLQVSGSLPDLSAAKRGWLLTMNHYHRPGFGIWWAAVALSAAFPLEIHWAVTSEWRNPRRLQPVSRVVIQRLAQTYGFSPLPPMPPAASEQTERALALRGLFQYVRSSERPVVGLAPEGMHYPYGGLMLPHPGAGRLVAALAAGGLSILPVGVYESDGCLVVHYGSPYELEFEPDLPRDFVDEISRWRVMREIAALLPESMRAIHSPLVQS